MTLRATVAFAILASAACGSGSPPPATGSSTLVTSPLPDVPTSCPEPPLPDAVRLAVFERGGYVDRPELPFFVLRADGSYLIRRAEPGWPIWSRGQLDESERQRFDGWIGALDDLSPRPDVGEVLARDQRLWELIVRRGGVWEIVRAPQQSSDSLPPPLAAMFADLGDRRGLPGTEITNDRLRITLVSDNTSMGDASPWPPNLPAPSRRQTRGLGHRTFEYCLDGSFTNAFRAEIESLGSTPRVLLYGQKWRLYARPSLAEGEALDAVRADLGETL